MSRWICAIVAGLALAHAVDQGLKLRSGQRLLLVGRSQRVRRLVGSVLVAALMGLVFTGLELVPPATAPRRFLAVWTAATLLTLLLLALGLLDWRKLRIHAQQHQRELRRLAEEACAPAPSAADDRGE